MIKNWFTAMPRWAQVRHIGLSIMLLALPVLAMAQDPDEKPQPLDPEAAKEQLWGWAGIAVIIVVPILWYWLRIWQIKRSGNVVDGESHIQD